MSEPSESAQPGNSPQGPWRKHPNDGDLYTPITPELVALIERMKQEHGTWRKVAALSETKLKVLRNIRGSTRKCISQKLLDRLCSTTGVGGIHEFTWFTANDLVALGIWDPVLYVEGTKRIHGDRVYEVEARAWKKKAKTQPKRRKRRRR